MCTYTHKYASCTPSNMNIFISGDESMATLGMVLGSITLKSLDVGLNNISCEGVSVLAITLSPGTRVYICVQQMFVIVCCMRFYVHLCVYVCARARACLCVCVYACVRVCVYVCVCVRVKDCVLVYVFARVCLCPCIYPIYCRA